MIYSSRLLRKRRLEMISKCVHADIVPLSKALMASTKETREVAVEAQAI